uniref:7TM_GPCR_Srx domain-containing protein n=1 Tax=Steinernema glaseri TaxID=37863 RepID=A0A1I7ZUW9_9BILA
MLVLDQLGFLGVKDRTVSAGNYTTSRSHFQGFLQRIRVWSIDFVAIVTVFLWDLSILYDVGYCIQLCFSLYSFYYEDIGNPGCVTDTYFIQICVIFVFPKLHHGSAHQLLPARDV